MDCAQISAQSSNVDSVSQIRSEHCSLNDCGFVCRTVTTELMALAGVRSLLSLFMLIVFFPHTWRHVFDFRAGVGLMVHHCGRIAHNQLGQVRYRWHIKKNLTHNLIDELFEHWFCPFGLTVHCWMLMRNSYLSSIDKMILWAVTIITSNSHNYKNFSSLVTRCLFM